MKRFIILTLCLMLVFSFVGCGKEKQTEVANPWKEWGSLTEAENDVGFTFGVPEIIEDSYIAESYRTLSGETPIIEVTYVDEDWTVVVRKAPGVGQDISGVYDYNYIQTYEWWSGETITYYRNEDSRSEMCSLKILFDKDGYSWSLFAPNGFWGDSCYGFLISILGI